jgi:hypothetical protein
MLMRRPWMSRTSRAVGKGWVGKVDVTDRVAVCVIFPPLVDPTVHLVAAEDGVRPCGCGIGASGAPGLLALQHRCAIRITGVDLWLFASSHRPA